MAIVSRFLHSSSSASAVKSATAVVAGTLFIALCAQARLPLGFTPVPVTLQVLGVLATGLVLGPGRGAAAAGLYLAMAAAGAPFWAGGQGGSAYLLAASGAVVAPTLGYLVAFPLSAAVTGWLWQSSRGRSHARAFACALAGVAVIHAGGLAWQWAQYSTQIGLANGLRASIAQGLLPFVLVDVAKAMCAAALARPVSAAYRRFTSVP